MYSPGKGPKLKKMMYFFYYTKKKDFLIEFLWLELVLLMLVYSSYIRLFFLNYLFQIWVIFWKIFSSFFQMLVYDYGKFLNFLFNKFKDLSLCMHYLNHISLLFIRDNLFLIMNIGHFFLNYLMIFDIGLFEIFL